MPTISVIIPALLNTPAQLHWLKSAVHSVRCQNRTDYEIVVCIDAGNSDIVSDFKAQYAGVATILTHDTKRGAGAARNTAIAAASGDYLLCLDSDDELSHDALALLSQHAAPDRFVYGNVQYTGEKTGIVELPAYNLTDLLRLTGIVPVTALHTKALWRSVGGFDEQLTALEDVDYWLKCARYGASGYHIDAVTLLYRRHAQSRQTVAELDRNSYAKTRDELQLKFKSLYNRQKDIKMPCASCPNPSEMGDGQMIRAEGLGNNTLQVRYNGPMQGSFTMVGWKTGLRYTIDGRGSLIEIDPADKEQFATQYWNGQLTFTFTDQSVADTAPLAAPIASVVPPQGNLPDISEMSATDAIDVINGITDIPDLHVLAAEERARETPRKTVLSAIEKRLQELS